MSKINAHEIIQKHGQKKGAEVFKNKISEYLKSNMSKSEYAEVTKFENSALGKKISNPSPAFSKELGEVSQKWGVEMGTKIAKKLEEKKSVKK